MHIAAIYTKFLTPRNLQEHMLRVASLASLIVESWSGVDIDKKSIMQCCLLHDIAKPLTFDISKQTQFGMAISDIANLEILQNLIKGKYGTSEHEALINICMELGLNSKAIRLLNNLESWSNIPRLLIDNDVESLIPIYCDMRIGPNGILPLEDRLIELSKRTGKSESLQDGIRLEDIIGRNINIMLKSINIIDLENIQEFKHFESL